MAHRYGRIVVVGGSIAGTSVVDALRRLGYDGHLTLIGDEPIRAYSRPALSKAAFIDGFDAAQHSLPPIEHDHEMLTGATANGLDLERRLVKLEGGEAIPWDGLVIATGARARTMRDLGRADDDVIETTLRSAADVSRLRSAVAQARDVVIVGAGILGMELASGCLRHGCRVTVVDVQAPLLQQLGGYLATAVLAVARSQGLQVVADDDIRLTRAGDKTLVQLSEGRVLDPDLVITAVGDMPNDEWLRSCGLVTPGRGLLVDDRGLVTSNIGAAGDVAAYPTQVGHRRTPFWNSAVDQATAVAASLISGEGAAAHVARPYFWTEQFGLSIKVCGQLPVEGLPAPMPTHGQAGGSLLLWERDGLPVTAAAINYRIAIPRLRAMLATDRTPQVSAART